jgi:NADH:ubiquinone oxidoreductase subunit 6 (subunit J)
MKNNPRERKHQPWLDPGQGCPMISNLIEVLQVVILVLMFIFLVGAIEYRKLSFAIIAFAVGNGFLSLSFFALGAPLVAVFNLSVFSGAVAILFLVTMNLDSSEVEEEEEDVLSEVEN